ncbi:purine and uridine phosphorylase [Lentithecium fluviatile CBS 122367]|uniref:Purine and uridine phosphorylase n=1 Tax=Lentithecium fluviatile CBS 122367 TaxID=1168545 RepID=A0A6G1IIX0_9PLEO|nr:purine and uridine phosphorylase [Lentithecium fluviatile CBS 122367]
MLDEEHKDLEHDFNDENLYSLGSIAGHNVVIGWLPMRATFTGIRLGPLVGIGGGVPSVKADIRLGDVVMTQSGFERTGSLGGPPRILLVAHFTRRAFYSPRWPGSARQPRDSEEEVVVHYGTTALGNQVIRDGRTRDGLSRELAGILFFEMEAASLMNSFPCLVIRGICDYADSDKNKTCMHTRPERQRHIQKRSYL